MSKYIAKPIEVDAFIIREVLGWEGDGGIGDTFRLVIGDDQPDTVNRLVIATPPMTARMVPVVYDYWVVQPDGYVYLNPKAVFEGKYHPK